MTGKVAGVVSARFPALAMQTIAQCCRCAAVAALSRSIIGLKRLKKIPGLKTTTGVAEGRSDPDRIALWPCCVGFFSLPSVHSTRSVKSANLRRRVSRLVYHSIGKFENKGALA